MLITISLLTNNCRLFLDLSTTLSPNNCNTHHLPYNLHGCNIIISCVVWETLFIPACTFFFSLCTLKYYLLWDETIQWCSPMRLYVECNQFFVYWTGKFIEITVCFTYFSTYTISFSVVISFKRKVNKIYFILFDSECGS